jgi:hypothetical protein
MRRRFLNIFLAMLLLVQPLVGAGVLAEMGSQLAAAEHLDSERPGCHDALPEPPDCCTGMDGVACGMDCGAASSAVTHAAPLAGDYAHGSFGSSVPYLTPISRPDFLDKPPRTS